MNKIFKKWVIHPIKRRVAKYYLWFLRKFTSIKVIGITGSAGKTTTKEMLASILKLDEKTVYSFANIDPVYNIPTTILKCTLSTKYLILEMGVEYPGEMDFYLWLAQPDIGVITNIFPTHTEFLKDIEGVLEEKSKLIKSLSKNSFAVLNESDSRLKSLVNKTKAKIIWFNGENSDAARKVAEVFGVSPENIKKGLKNFDRPKHRYEIIIHKSGAIIFDDSYNSNPEALLVTLKKFNELAGNRIKIAVLGDMLELGKLEKSEHIRIGNEVKKYNFEKVFGVGKSVKYITSKIYDDALDVLPELKTMLKKDIYILIKGSRSIGLDRLVEKLL
ncbi:MAG: Mur ligase family protein [Patescibacteria group bacterium]